MLTDDQQNWINHLPDTDKIMIVALDHSAEEKFQKIKSIIQSNLGKDVDVQHHGASSLGISGQDEIDIYIPVSPENYDTAVAQVAEIFGEPRSTYPLQRARFRTAIDGKKIDIFVANKTHPDWTRLIKFENYLKTHPEDLEEYRKLKEKCSGLSTREYYRNKFEFINDIMSKSK